MTPDLTRLVAPLVKPLDLSNVMKHAFLSGIVAARNIPGYDEINGPELWVAYDPQPNPAYDRIIAALNPAALAEMLAEAREQGRIEEKARIIEALRDEADLTPCYEDAKVVSDCADLIEHDFSYEAVDSAKEPKT